MAESTLTPPWWLFEHCFMQDKAALSSSLIVLPKCIDASFYWADMQNTDTDGGDLTHCFLRSGLLPGTFFQFVPRT